MKKLTFLLFLIIKIQKKKKFKCFRGKIDAKTGRKSLKKNWKNWKARLARKRPIEKSKGALSAKAHAKPEVSVKIKLPSAYIRRRKQKKNGRSLRTHALDLYLRGNPLSLFIFFHPPQAPKV